MRSGLAPLKVVVVDDSPCVRQMLSDMLTQSGEFFVAGHGRDGDEAVRLVAELDPDVIVMDVEMPMVSGLDALRTIRTRSNSTTQVVLLTRTGRGMGRDIAYGKMLGAAAVLKKPEAESLHDIFKLSQELLETVRSLRKAA